jgi:hypothetical protein
MLNDLKRKSFVLQIDEQIKLIEWLRKNQPDQEIHLGTSYTHLRNALTDIQQSLIAAKLLLMRGDRT